MAEVNQDLVNDGEGDRADDWAKQAADSTEGQHHHHHINLAKAIGSGADPALGAMKVARQMGRQIPHDLAIVGYDNIPESPYFTPGLTTVRQGLTEMGHRGVKQLVAMINNGDHMHAPPIVLQPELIIRESSVNTELIHETKQ